LFCEAYVRDDKREIFFVAAHGEDDADVTKLRKRQRRMIQRVFRRP